MASITSAGIGSGLDVASLVSQLVAAERAAPDSRIANAESKAQTTLSAIGAFRSALAGFEDAAKALRDGAVLKQAATSSNTGLLNATISSTAAVGSYSVEVLQLAKVHKLASAPYGSSSDSIGQGRLTLTSGSESFSIEIGPEQDSLAGLRDAINNASDNPGIRATLLNTAAGVRLTLTATTTGEAGAVTVAAETLAGDPILPSGTGLDAFSYSSGNEQLEQVDAAQNASIKIDGYSFTSSTNVFANAVDGLSFAASKAEPGTTFTVTVAQDQEAAKTAVQNFVTRYNVLNAAISTYTRFDAATQTAGPLLGDATVRSLTQQARAILSRSVGEGSVQNLSQIGVTAASDGSYRLDPAKLSTTLQSDPSAVHGLFNADGIGGALVELTKGYLDTDGRIAGKQDSLNAQLKDLSKQRTALDRRIDSVEARYRAQFTALDTLISQLRTTSSYLTQQLAALPGNSS